MRQPSSFRPIRSLRSWLQTTRNFLFPPHYKPSDLVKSKFWKDQLKLLKTHPVTFIGRLAVPLVLIIGVAASIYLVNLNQDIRQQAQEDPYACDNMASTSEWSVDAGDPCCGGGIVECKSGICSAEDGKVGECVGPGCMKWNGDHAKEGECEDRFWNGAWIEQVCRNGYWDAPEPGQCNQPAAQPEPGDDSETCYFKQMDGSCSGPSTQYCDAINAFPTLDECQNAEPISTGTCPAGTHLDSPGSCVCDNNNAGFGLGSITDPDEVREHCASGTPRINQCQVTKGDSSYDVPLNTNTCLGQTAVQCSASGESSTQNCLTQLKVCRNGACLTPIEAAVDVVKDALETIVTFSPETNTIEVEESGAGPNQPVEVVIDAEDNDANEVVCPNGSIGLVENGQVIYCTCNIDSSRPAEDRRLPSEIDTTNEVEDYCYACYSPNHNCEKQLDNCQGIYFLDRNSCSQYRDRQQECLLSSAPNCPEGCIPDHLGILCIPEI